MEVFAYSDFVALFPGNLSADTNYMPLGRASDAPLSPGASAQSGTSALFPGNLSADINYMPLGRASDAPLTPGASAQSGTSALFPGNLSADTNYMPLGTASGAPLSRGACAQSGTSALFPGNLSADTNYMPLGRASDAPLTPGASAQSGTSALFPGNLSADINYMPLGRASDAPLTPGASAQSGTSGLFPGNLSADTNYMPLGRASDAPLSPGARAQSGTSALFPGNLSADINYMPLGRASDAPLSPGARAQSGTSALFPANFGTCAVSENLSAGPKARLRELNAGGMDSRSRGENNDLGFLCLDSGLERWERLALDDQTQSGGFGSSVLAFERMAGEEGARWKHALRRLQPYSSTLMRDGMLQFACRHHLHTHLVSARTVMGYVEAWLAYTNVSVLVQEAHARQQDMHPATRGLLCEMAHDMYRQAMLAAATGQRKRAVWFYDTNTRKKRKLGAWDARQ